MNLLKAIGLSVGTAILSTVLTMQAITNVLENDQPALAASVSPLNGFALERIAFSRFQSEGGGALEPLLKQVLKKEPLSPTAWTILALAQENDAKKEEILLAASKLNRRTLPLQSSLLLLYASRDDLINSTKVLNQILAVYPEQQETIFPILIQALKDERSIPQIVQALSNRPGWSDKFLTAASRDSDALTNLTRLRMSLLDKISVERDTDEAIINGLVHAGRLESAAELYRRISEPSAGGGIGAVGKLQRLNWSTKMPPFDWQLNDSPGERAQVVEKPDRLEFFVRRGKAGVLAERILAVPNSFRLEIKHSISPVQQLEDIRIELECQKTKKKFFDQSFTQSPSKYSVGPVTSDCEYARLSLSARAWSDKADIRGTIYSIVLVPL
tara:strand:+ start:35764 stop:36921 length:1158 start_codon:yes stop_codon:yes gene_type:complete